MEERFFEVAHIADRGVLYLLLILSVVSLALIVERFLFLNRLAQSAKRFQDHVQALLARADFQSLLDLKSKSGPLEARAVELGIQTIRESAGKGIRESFDTFILLEKPKLERSLGFLATVGANAPYIGLFGTVLGIMKAFRDLGAGSEAGQGAVMAGISGALIATAAGLMVAIPAVLAFNYFQKQVKQIVSGIEATRELSVIVFERGGVDGSKNI
jgi:biopolymer transport protein TolQ